MRNLVLFLLLGSVCFGAGWKQLYNGKELTGWKMAGPGRSVVEDVWVVKTRSEPQKVGRRNEEPLTITASGRTPSPQTGELVDHGRRKRCGASADLGSLGPGSRKVTVDTVKKSNATITSR
jgi:hypothetical protein